MSSWLDRTIGYVAPRWGLNRTRARIAADLIERHYEAAAAGRRTEGWRRSSGDANAVTGWALSRTRVVARDLVRNNAHADSALETIKDHTVGWGIVAKPQPDNAQAAKAWKAWAETTDCDADGRGDFYDMQKLVIRTIVESGEVLIRRRFRLPTDGFALPLQLQVLEGDYLDTSRTGIILPNGGRIIHGVEFDPIGRRAAYWLFPEHPGDELFGRASASRRIPAESILHVYRQNRPGQVRGISWFAPVTLKLKDFDEYDDAQLLKQKIAAYLAVVVTDPTGENPTFGIAEDQDPAKPYVDHLKPGGIVQGPPGSSIQVVQPPRVAEFKDYAEVTLRTIATGLGVTYEDLTGDYGSLSFSAARMSRIRHWARVDNWRWNLIIPQFCQPVWRWAMDAAAILGLAPTGIGVEWTAPPPPMIEPDKEGLAYQRLVRSGLMSLSEALRERGYDPKTVFNEMKVDNDVLDESGLILDSDPRRTTQAGQFQQAGGAGDGGAAASPTEEPT